MLKTLNTIKPKSESLDYDYTDIQNNYSGSASDLMYFPTGSTEWLKSWFDKIKKNGPE